MELPEPEENGPTPPQTTEENRAKEERLQKAEREVEEAAEENADSCSDAESETAPSDRGYRKSYSDAESQTSRLPLTPERSRECYSRARMLLPRIHHHLDRELEIEAENLREQVSQLTQEKLDLIKEAEASSAVAFWACNLREQVSQLTQENLDLLKEHAALRAFKLKRSRPGKSQRADKKKQFEEPAALAPLRTARSNRRTKQMQFVRT